MAVDYSVISVELQAIYILQYLVRSVAEPVRLRNYLFESPESQNKNTIPIKIDQSSSLNSLIPLFIAKEGSIVMSICQYGDPLDFSFMLKFIFTEEHSYDNLMKYV